MKSPPLPDISATDLLAILPPEQRARLRKRPQPEWINTMLATLMDRRFSDANWLFELKFDGERCLAFRKRGAVRLFLETANFSTTPIPKSLTLSASRYWTTSRWMRRSPHSTVMSPASLACSIGCR